MCVPLLVLFFYSVHCTPQYQSLIVLVPRKHADPGLVAFLKKKPFRKETTVEVEQEPMDQGTEVEGMRESSEEVNELHRKWPHMDVLEEDKLEWTKSLPDKDPSQVHVILGVVYCTW